MYKSFRNSPFVQTIQLGRTMSCIVTLEAFADFAPLLLADKEAALLVPRRGTCSCPLKPCSQAIFPVSQ